MNINILYFFHYICREFYYIQMEKYARQAVSEGVKAYEQISVSIESEIYRVLNLHYNRNNHIEVGKPTQNETLLNTLLK
jgi:Homeo-prospero domain